MIVPGVKNCYDWLKCPMPEQTGSNKTVSYSFLLIFALTGNFYKLSSKLS